MRKKEDPAKVAARVRKYRQKPNREKIEIIGLTIDDKEKFYNLKGLEDITHAAKLRALINLWNAGEQKPEPAYLPKEKLAEPQVVRENIPEQIIQPVKKNLRFRISDSALKEFLEKNQLSLNVIEKRVNTFLDAGLTHDDIEPYLIYLMKIFQANKRMSVRDLFMGTLMKETSMQNFLQVREGQERKTNEMVNPDGGAHVTYALQMLQQTTAYLKDHEQLFFRLIKENQYDYHIQKALNDYGMSMNILKSDYVATVLLPKIMNYDDFNFISFENWKKRGGSLS